MRSVREDRGADQKKRRWLIYSRLGLTVASVHSKEKEMARIHPVDPDTSYDLFKALMTPGCGDSGDAPPDSTNCGRISQTFN